MRFSPFIRTGLAVILAVSLGGCATNGDLSPGDCALIGGGVGAVGGGVGAGLYAHNNHRRDDENWEAVGIAGTSALVGAGLGYLICSLTEDDEPEPTRRAAPPPAPAPAPRPAPTPAPAPARPDPCTERVRLENVNFANDKSDIQPQAAASLDEAITQLQRCPDRRVRLSAYTDSSGSDQYNQALSERRAKSVRDYLVSHGIDAGRIDAQGLGESNPVSDNSTPEGRAENRRVELEPIN